MLLDRFLLCHKGNFPFFFFQGAIYGAPTKSLSDEVEHVIDTIQKQLKYTSDIQYTRYDESLTGIKNLKKNVLDAARFSVVGMFAVAGERIDGLKQQGVNAGVNIDQCFVDIETNMLNAIRPFIDELKETADADVEQCANENAIILSVINNANQQVVDYSRDLINCKDDTKCLQELLDTVLNHVDLAYTVTLTVEKSLKNMKYASQDIVKTHSTSIRDAQYKLDRVIGLLDKCVHETIHH